jgi:hypothetical protein
MMPTPIKPKWWRMSQTEPTDADSALQMFLDPIDDVRRMLDNFESLCRTGKWHEALVGLQMANKWILDVERDMLEFMGVDQEETLASNSRLNIRMANDLMRDVQDAFGPGTGPFETFSPEQLLSEFMEYEHGTPKGRKFPAPPHPGGYPEMVAGLFDTEWRYQRHYRKTPDEELLEEFAPMISRIREKLGVELSRDERGRWHGRSITASTISNPRFAQAGYDSFGAPTTEQVILQITGIIQKVRTEVETASRALSAGNLNVCLNAIKVAQGALGATERFLEATGASTGGSIQDPTEFEEPRVREASISKRERPRFDFETAKRFAKW